jgi:hypothetical protein
LAADFCGCGEALVMGKSFLPFEQIKQPAQGQMSILRLRAAVRGSDGKARGAMANGRCRAHLVDVLASGASRAREALLKVLAANAQGIHSVEQWVAPAHT